MADTAKQFDDVSVVCKANVYFDGKVVSHTILFKNGTKKTLGLIYPGAYNFGTGVAEVMEIVAGSCRVKPAGSDTWTAYASGTSFRVSGKSSFDISVDDGIMEYICSYEG